MKPHDWMVTYTPQTDWIKGGGLIVWLSFFTGLFGSGAYLASLYFNNLTGMVVSWFVIAIVKSGLHVGHARRPLKLWRMVLKVRTSWIARGTVFTALTAVFGAVQIVLSYEVAGAPIEVVFRVLTGLAAFAVMIYEGFTINYISGIPFWNSSLLPVTLVSWGILNGLALLSAIIPSGTATAEVTTSGRTVLIITAALTIFYLWNALYAGAASKESMKQILGSLLFWIGAVLIGIIVPLVILFSGSELGAPSALVFFICEIIGGLAFTHCVFKAGVYRPLI
jgi:formate-dependent nitrite reductase membrane component NrfD